MHRRPLINVSQIKLETRTAYCRQGAKLCGLEHLSMLCLAGGLYLLPVLSPMASSAAIRTNTLLPWRSLQHTLRLTAWEEHLHSREGEIQLSGCSSALLAFTVLQV